MLKKLATKRMPTIQVTQACFIWHERQLAAYEAQLRDVSREMAKLRESASIRQIESELRSLYEKDCWLQNKICLIKKALADFWIDQSEIAKIWPISVGSVVTLLFCAGRGGTVEYLIDGASWKPKGKLLVVSSGTPLAQNLLGKRIDDVVTYEVFGTKHVAQIVDLYSYSFGRTRLG